MLFNSNVVSMNFQIKNIFPHHTDAHANQQTQITNHKSDMPFVTMHKYKIEMQNTTNH